VDDHPARDVDAARTRRRRSWVGQGRLVTDEKDPLGCLLHDAVRVFGDVSVPATPTLLYVLLRTDEATVDLKAGAFFCWLSLVATGTLVCGGWVGVPATPRRGWLSLTLSTALVRLVGVNGALLAAAHGSLLVTPWVGPAATAGLAAAVGVVTGLGLPAVGERAYDALER
jgi:hypothetical protein